MEQRARLRGRQGNITKKFFEKNSKNLLTREKKSDIILKLSHESEGSETAS